VNEFNGTFVDWHLKLWGEAIDADKQGLLPMPSEHDDDDHDQIVVSTTTIAGTTQPVTVLPTSSTLMAKPSDHPDRPINAKPSGTEEETTPPSATASAEPEATPTKSSWLPSFFPTFGVSSKTQIWIYGAAGLILIFCAGLGVYFYMARRKRLLNNPRDEWEFDLLEEDEAEGLNGAGRAKAGKGGKRRAGELYDAFAAGSEDESESEEAYADGAEGGDEREKKLYDDDDEDEAKHVIGDDDDESQDEKGSQRGKLLQK
jgi:kexin